MFKTISKCLGQPIAVQISTLYRRSHRLLGLPPEHRKPEAASWVPGLCLGFSPVRWLCQPGLPRTFTSVPRSFRNIPELCTSSTMQVASWGPRPLGGVSPLALPGCPVGGEAVPWRDLAPESLGKASWMRVCGTYPHWGPQRCQEEVQALAPGGLLGKCQFSHS